MKRNKYILKVTLVSMLALVLNACYEDKGNYEYMDLPQVEVRGIKDAYTSNLLEILDIDPQITTSANSQEYDYMWMCYDKRDLKKKIDTLSTDKHLMYKMNLPLSTYQLIFAYKDRKTQVTKYVNSNLTVQSAYSRGWYVLKENAGNTELDFFTGDTKQPNLLSQMLQSPVQGKPRFLGYVLFTYLDKEKNTLVKENQSFVIMSEKDMRIVRISDMKEMARFDNLFFENAPACKPVFWYVDSEENGFYNDGKLYAYSERDGQLGVSKFSFPKGGDYQLSPVFTKNATFSPLMFDLKHGKFCTTYKSLADIKALEDDGSSAIKNDFSGFEPLYFGFLSEGLWEGGKMYAVMQKKADNSRCIVYINSTNLVYYDPAFLKNQITKVQNIDGASKFAKATCFGQNRKFELMYFAVADKLYAYDLQNNVEREVTREGGQSVVPPGEQITMIKHIVFDYSDWQDPNIKEQVEKLVVATATGTGYKLYLFDPQANNVKTNPQVYEGTGKPTQVFYMSPFFDNTDICY